jgi:hypothetical protein
MLDLSIEVKNEDEYTLVHLVPGLEDGVRPTFRQLPRDLDKPTITICAAGKPPVFRGRGVD